MLSAPKHIRFRGAIYTAAEVFQPDIGPRTTMTDIEDQITKAVKDGSLAFALGNKIVRWTEDGWLVFDKAGKAVYGPTGPQKLFALPQIMRLWKKDSWDEEQHGAELDKALRERYSWKDYLDLLTKYNWEFSSPQDRERERKIRSELGVGPEYLKKLFEGKPHEKPPKTH